MCRNKPNFPIKGRLIDLIQGHPMHRTHLVNTNTVKKKVGMSHQIWCNKAVSTVPPYLVGKSHQLLKVGNSHHLFTPNVVGCHTDIRIICLSNVHNRKGRAVWFHDNIQKHVFARAIRRGCNSYVQNDVV